MAALVEETAVVEELAHPEVLAEVVVMGGLAEAAKEF